MVQSVITRGNASIPAPKWGVTQTMDVTTSATFAGPFSSNVELIRIISDTDVHARFGQSATASINSTLIAAFTEQTLRVTGIKGLSVVKDTLEGTCWVTELI